MLRQAEEMGTSLGETLAVFSDDMRAKRMLYAEEKAMALPAKMMIPLILFIFPCLIGVLMLPAAHIAQAMGHKAPPTGRGRTRPQVRGREGLRRFQQSAVATAIQRAANRRRETPPPPDRFARALPLLWEGCVSSGPIQRIGAIDWTHCAGGSRQAGSLALAPAHRC